MHRTRVVLTLCLLGLTVAGATLAPATITAQEDEATVVLAEDAFDDAATGMFFESETEDFRFSYDEGRFVMESIGDFSGSLNAPLLDVVADGTIAVDARLRGPVEGRYLVVGCRGNHAGQAYEFLLDPTAGTVALYTGVGEGSVELVPQTVHDAVHTGARTNRMELVCLGETITGRINDVDVFSVTDGGYEQGSFYVGGATFSGVTGSLEAVFDNLLVTVPAETSDRAARDGVRELDRLRDDATAGESLFGPARGELRPSASDIAFRSSGVDLADFYATATFVAPYDATEHHWDAGFAFGDVKDGPYRLMLLSTGRWYLTVGAGLPIASGLIDGLETAEGGENEIALAVTADIGHLEVNGDYVAAIELPEPSRGGDVWIGTAFYANSFVEGEATTYRGFEVWALGESAQPDESDADEPPDEEGERDLPRLPIPAPGPSGDVPGQDVDEGPEPAPATDTVTVPLAEMDGSGLTGQATLTAEADGTKVALRVRDVPGDTIAVIQEGPCTALAEPTFQLNPLNDAGVSVTRLEVAFDQLLSSRHAIVVYDAAGGEPTLPLVCGEIEGR
ncbi:MAG: hypothetical protein ACRDJW_14945 [Thermomicrobiales bacterium]